MLKWFQIGFALVAAATSGMILYQTVSSFHKLSGQASSQELKLGEAEVVSNAHEGGHSQPAKASGHGEQASGHGEQASGHGEQASEHGEQASGHGSESPERKTASAQGVVPFVSLDEVFANVSEEQRNHTLALKVDIEFFNMQAKETFKAHQPAVKHLIIQTSREQDYENLATLSGKLYFKELLIRKMNDHFQKAIVRDVHFASFFLQ